MVGAKRVFAYLKPNYGNFENILKALRTIDAAVVIHAPGVSENVVRNYTAANVAFCADPVRMSDVRRECHLGICHAGVGTVEALVTAGKPVLALPQQLEQLMTAKRLLALGAGLVVEPKESRDYGRILRRLLDEPSFTAAAQAVAARHVDDDPAQRVMRIAERCEELLSGARGGSGAAMDVRKPDTSPPGTKASVET
jgi:UDP:flavonoid glycosyltransferase YjiC (YdhE family)